MNFELCFVLEWIPSVCADSEIYDFPWVLTTRRVSASHLTTRHGVCYTNPWSQYVVGRRSLCLADTGCGCFRKTKT